VQIDEGLEAAAARLLRDKAGLEGVYLEQLHAFGAPGRDPRGRVISIAFIALLPPTRFEGASAVRMPLRVAWRGTLGGPVEVRDTDGRKRALFLDHADILGVAVRRLRVAAEETPIACALLPPVFTLRALQDTYEAIRGEPTNKDSFRRRVLAAGWIEPTGERERDVLHRPAELFRAVKKPMPMGAP
jgi:8-oxo-dGTP diphosphatase